MLKGCPAPKLSKDQGLHACACPGPSHAELAQRAQPSGCSSVLGTSDVSSSAEVMHTSVRAMELRQCALCSGFGDFLHRSFMRHVPAVSVLLQLHRGKGLHRSCGWLLCYCIFVVQVAQLQQEGSDSSTNNTSNNIAQPSSDSAGVQDL